jgi:hypothetical protein
MKGQSEDQRFRSQLILLNPCSFAAYMGCRFRKGDTALGIVT